MSGESVLLVGALVILLGTIALTECLSGGFRVHEVRRWLTCLVRGHLWEARPHVGVTRSAVEVARFCDRCQRWFRWRV